MKWFSKTIALSVVIVLFGVRVNAQSSADANVSVTIVTPLIIEGNAGSIVDRLEIKPVPGYSLFLKKAGTILNSMKLVLPAAKADIVIAEFTVKGGADQLYDISLPNSILLLQNGSDETIVSENLKVVGETGILSCGEQHLKIDADLKMDINQPKGLYISTAFEVRMNMN